MTRAILSDYRWERIRSALHASGAYLTVATRQTVEGIFWRMRTGAPWRDLPDAFGPWQTVKSGREIEGQLLRSSRSVGASYEEARGADSKADFCNKLQISFKEMRETRYWLCLTDRAALIADRNKLGSLIDEATQLRSILGKSVATARGKARGKSDPSAPNLPPA